MSTNLKDKKEKLQEESDKFEESLNEEFSEVTEKVKSLAAKFLVIGGGALISYLIVKAILGKDKEEKEEEGKVREKIIIKSTPQSIFFKSLSDKAALVVLELAREMLVKFLSRSEKDEEEENIS